MIRRADLLSGDVDFFNNLNALNILFVLLKNVLSVVKGFQQIFILVWLLVVLVNIDVFFVRNVSFKNLLSPVVIHA